MRYFEKEAVSKELLEKAFMSRLKRLGRAGNTIGGDLLAERTFKQYYNLPHTPLIEEVGAAATVMNPLGKINFLKPSGRPKLSTKLLEGVGSFSPFL